MISQLTLVSHDLCPYVQRVEIALTEKGIAHQRRFIDLSDKPAWFRAISPLGKVPLLQVETEDGEQATLFESTVICEFLEECYAHPLLPETALARARHRAWIAFAGATLDAVAGFYNAETAAAFESKRRALAERFTWLERNLETEPYFAGESFGLVDAAFAPLFRYFAGESFGLVDAAFAPLFRYFDRFETIGGLYFFKDLPRCTAYRKALSARPSVQAAVKPDYPDKLSTFLAGRSSHLGTLARAA